MIPFSLSKIQFWRLFDCAAPLFPPGLAPPLIIDVVMSGSTPVAAYWPQFCVVGGPLITTEIDAFVFLVV